MSKVRANGVEIYYELHGPADRDVLVLTNGILMSTASWGHQLPLLARHFRVLLHDCRGQWQSEHPPGPYSMEMHAADLLALMDALDVERAHVGGISYGAEIGMTFALAYPERLRSLWLASCVSQVDPVLRGIAESWLQAAIGGDPERFYLVTYPFNFGEAWISTNRPLLDAARARYSLLDMPAVAELCRAFLAFDVTADLPRISAPCLVVVGEDDILKPRRYADIVARMIPGAELAVLPRAGHALIWEQPGAFNSLLLGFLTKHSPASA